MFAKLFIIHYSLWSAPNALHPASRWMFIFYCVRF